MYQVERLEPTGAIKLTATGSTPVELLQAALRGVLDTALGRTGLATERQDRAEPASGLSIPVRGTGADLGLLFIDLSQDLLAQIEEYGRGFDDFRLDGMLRTETGGYTAWGYLSGSPSGNGAVATALSVAQPDIAEADGGWRLVGELRPG
jgi:hypothetical protein